jgi:hypothetical protein
MIPITALLFGPGLILTVEATVPTYNNNPTCRAAIELSGRSLEMCQASEAQAHGDIVKGWSTFTESAKVHCLQLNARPAPSYVELLACLESMRNMQNHLGQDPAHQ